MISVTPALISLSLYILIWDKLPFWGNWFNYALDKCPSWIRTLYDQWRCPFCVGFWLAGLVHLTVGLWTVGELETYPVLSGWPTFVLYIFLDCLSCATLVYVGNLILSVLLSSTIRGHEIKIDYMRASSAEHERGEQPEPTAQRTSAR